MALQIFLHPAVVRGSSSPNMRGIRYAICRTRAGTEEILADLARGSIHGESLLARLPFAAAVQERHGEVPCPARRSAGAERGMFCAFAACPIEAYLRILNQSGLVEKEIHVNP